MSAPNLLSPTTVTGKVAGLAVTNSASAIVSNASGSGQSIFVRSLIVSNIVNTGSPTVDVDVYKNATTAYRITYQLIIPGGAPIAVLTADRPIILEENDSLRLTASASSKLEAIAVYEVIS